MSAVFRGIKKAFHASARYTGDASRAAPVEADKKDDKMPAVYCFYSFS
jgi:hypothetical protein